MPMTDAEFGLLTSVFLWVYGLLSPFAGYLADKFNRSRVIIISLFVWSVVTWLTAHVTTFEQLLVTRALMGVSEACYIPAALALIADYHRGSTRSMANGIHMAGIMAGQSLGFVGGWIAEKHNWTTAFAAFGIFGIVYALVISFSLKDRSDKAQSKASSEVAEQVGFFKGIADLFSRSTFLLMVIFWSLISIVSWMIVGWLPTYYKEHFDLSQAMAGVYATGYLYPVSVLGVLLGGFLADRWSKNHPKARILVPAIGLCIAAPAIFFASNTLILPIAVFCFMIYALTKAFSDVNMMPILCMVVNPRYRATGYGVLNLFSCIVGGVGLYAGGALRDAKVDLSTIYQWAALLMAISVILLLIIKSKTQVNNEHI
jgi:MFS family permease